MSGIITIYTDGACSGNPGKGGWGAVILKEEKEIHTSIDMCMELREEVQPLTIRNHGSANRNVLIDGRAKRKKKDFKPEVH